MVPGPRVKENKEPDMNNCEILYVLDFDKVLQTFSFHCVKAFSNEQFSYKSHSQIHFSRSQSGKKKPTTNRERIVMLFYSMQI